MRHFLHHHGTSDRDCSSAGWEEKLSRASKPTKPHTWLVACSTQIQHQWICWHQAWQSISRAYSSSYSEIGSIAWIEASDDSQVNCSRLDFCKLVPWLQAAISLQCIKPCSPNIGYDLFELLGNTLLQRAKKEDTMIKWMKLSTHRQKEAKILKNLHTGLVCCKQTTQQAWENESVSVPVLHLQSTCDFDVLPISRLLCPGGQLSPSACYQVNLTLTPFSSIALQFLETYQMTLRLRLCPKLWLCMVRGLRMLK